MVKKVLPELKIWSVALAISIAITAVHHFCSRNDKSDDARTMASHKVSAPVAGSWN